LASWRRTSLGEGDLAFRCIELGGKLRLPVDSTEIGSPTGQRRLLADILERLPESLEPWQPYLEELVLLVIAVVESSRRAGGSRWPEGQPAQVFDALIERALVDGERPTIPAASDLAVEALHVFLVELGRAADHEPPFLVDQRLLVDKAIDKMSEDLPFLGGVLPFLGGPGSGRAVRLAEMLARDYSFTRGAKQREKSISKLEKLVRKVPEHYADPFIQDLLVVYRRMNLGAIESKHMLE